MIEDQKTAIVRIVDQNGPYRQAVGAGFVVSHALRLVVTCAHVLEDAFARSIEHITPEDTIFLDFPFTNQDKVFQSHLFAHKAKQDDGSGDIAVLQLSEAPPNQSSEVQMIIADSYRGDEFIVFGFPQGAEAEGRWAEGKLQERLVNGQIQAIGTTSQGYYVEPGFSGSPVFDTKLDGIVGIMARVDLKTEIRAAFVTTIEQIAELPIMISINDLRTPASNREPQTDGTAWAESLIDLTIRSGRIRPKARESLLIEIGVDPDELDFLEMSVTDFSRLLVTYLQKRADYVTLQRLCRAIRPRFQGSSYLSKLDTICTEFVTGR